MFEMFDRCACSNVRSLCSFEMFDRCRLLEAFDRCALFKLFSCFYASRTSSAEPNDRTTWTFRTLIANFRLFTTCYDLRVMIRRDSAISFILTDPERSSVNENTSTLPVCETNLILCDYNKWIRQSTQVAVKKARKNSNFRRWSLVFKAEQNNSLV